MESGSPIPVGDISHGQQYYDALVSQTQCSGASDTLECLRQVPFNTLMAAIDASPGLFSFQVCHGDLQNVLILNSWISRFHLLGSLGRTAFSLRTVLKV